MADGPGADGPVADGPGAAASAHVGLDPRLHAVRADLADAGLQGRVEAARFAVGAPGRVAAAQAPLRRAPDGDAVMLTEALHGETLLVFDRRPGWAWVQLDADRYVGWIAAAALAADTGTGAADATHRVTARRTFLFARPDIKSRVVAALPLGATLRVCGEAQDLNARYLEAATGGFIAAQHAAPLAAGGGGDWVATAEGFLGVPYLWGGKTDAGIDCSGLVQVALAAAGRSAPRDSDMQERALGEALDIAAGLPLLQRGDLVFWPGHVGIMSGPTTLLHAGAAHMQVAAEPLAAASGRYLTRGVAISSVRRLASA